MAVNLREYSVEIFSQVMLLRGRATSIQRLSDLANEPEHFLHLTGVQVWPYSPETVLGLEGHEHGMVNKASIVLLAELEATPLAGSDTQRTGLFIEKMPQRVLIYTERFAINAQVHMAAGVKMDHVLAGSQLRFIPLTRATVMPTQPGTQLTSFRREFILINRDHVNYIGAADQMQSRPTGEADDMIG